MIRDASMRLGGFPALVRGLGCLSRVYVEFAYEDYVGFRVDKHVMSVPCIHTLFRTRRLFAVQRSLYLSWIIIEQASMSAFLFFSRCGIPDSEYFSGGWMLSRTCQGTTATFCGASSFGEKMKSNLNPLVSCLVSLVCGDRVAR